MKKKQEVAENFIYCFFFMYMLIYITLMVKYIL